MLEIIKKDVYEILGKDRSGHGMDHANNVLKLTDKFCKELGANVEIASIIALLHDVDDYKLFGDEQSYNLTNAKLVLNDANVPLETQEIVLSEISKIGFHKRLDGIVPDTLEGKIVSDADMCDAIGAHGLIRTCVYSFDSQRPFFDRNIFPNEDVDGKSYTTKSGASSINHCFEKLLKLKYLMLTSSGKKEANKRNDFLIDFLVAYFKEEDAPEWTKYLDNYLAKQKKMNK